MAVPKRAKTWIGRPVCVIWLDAAYKYDPMRPNVDPMLAMTFGLLHTVNDEYVRIIGEFFTDEQGRQVTAIPVGMIKRIVPWPGWTVPMIFKRTEPTGDIEAILRCK